MEKAISENSHTPSHYLLRSGIYKPSSKSRSYSFILSPGSKITGGYSDGKSKGRSIISGDIGKINDSSDNLYHVVTLTSNNSLKNITIASGNANGKEAHGGGVLFHL